MLFCLYMNFTVETVRNVMTVAINVMINAEKALLSSQETHSSVKILLEKAAFASNTQLPQPTPLYPS